MKLNSNSAILKSLAKDVAVMMLSNKVHENRGGGTLVCGTPNEVAPDPMLDDYFDVIHRDLACIGCQNSYGAYDKQKATVWAMNVLEGEDQVSACCYILDFCHFDSQCASSLTHPLAIFLSFFFSLFSALSTHGMESL